MFHTEYLVKSEAVSKCFLRLKDDGVCLLMLQVRGLEMASRLAENLRDCQLAHQQTKPSEYEQPEDARPVVREISKVSVCFAFSKAQYRRFAISKAQYRN